MSSWRETVSMNLVTAGQKLTLLFYLVYYISLCIIINAGSRPLYYHHGNEPSPPFFKQKVKVWIFLFQLQIKMITYFKS